MTIIRLDGIRIKITPTDLDGDGVTGGIEIIQQQRNDVTEIVQQTELGETFRELNKDEVDPSTRLSTIDMNTRLSSIEVAAMTCYDAAIGLNIMSTKNLILTRVKKRNNVSLDGLGRQERVEMVVGKREHDENMAGKQSLSNKFKSFLGMGGQ